LTNDDCFTINQPPYADNLQALAGSYCSGVSAGGLVSFKWNYQDEECDTEKMFELQISKNSSFDSAGLVIDKVFSGLSVACGSLNQQTFYVRLASASPTSSCAPHCENINYGVPYYWRVKVWENGTGYSSDWINYADLSDADDDGNANTYTYIYPHPAPNVIYGLPDYDFISTFPAPGDPVYFKDSSVCYNEESPYSCANIAECAGECYTWNFGDEGYNSDPESNPPVVYTIGDVTHIYTQAKVYSSSLQICDEVACCSAVKGVPVKTGGSKELPNWKEVSPFQ
jgi:hypothetical protein